MIRGGKVSRAKKERTSEITEDEQRLGASRVVFSLGSRAWRSAQGHINSPGALFTWKSCLNIEIITPVINLYLSIFRDVKGKKKPTTIISL